MMVGAAAVIAVATLIHDHVHGSERAARVGTVR
jgi:hypothetical protein